MKHNWSPYPHDTIGADESVDGIGRTLRICERCDAMKITAYDRDQAWREWALRDGTRLKTMPECRGENAAKPRKLVPFAGQTRQGASGSA